MVEEGREDTLPRIQDSKLKIVFKRKRFAPVLHEVLVDAKDAATLQALLGLVGLSMETQLDRCKIGMPGPLGAEDYLPGVHSLRKADAEFVGCCMAGYVREPTIESEWQEFLRAVAESAHSWQEGVGYETEDGEGNAKGPADRAMEYGKIGGRGPKSTTKSRVVLFFC